MYFAFDSCTKGDKCPYLHDKNNLYNGAKPKALAKSTPAGSATIHACAATIMSGTVAASSVSGVKSQGASSLLAPSHGVWEQVSNFCGRGKSCKKHSKRTSKTVLKKPGNNHHPYAFERASKCFAAMASVRCPMNVNQDFLIDWGAGEPQKSSSLLPK